MTSQLGVDDQLPSDVHVAVSFPVKRYLGLHEKLMTSPKV